MHDMSSLDVLKRFEEHIVKAVKEVALVEIKNRPDWFTELELELSIRIFLHNQAQHIHDHKETEETRNKFKHQRSLLQ